MSFFYTPQIGEHGVFTLAAPLNNYLVPDTEYVCQAIRRISDYYASNENQFLLQNYLACGLTEEDLEADRVDNIQIISLQCATGVWAYVPERYFTQPIIVNGVPYAGRSITVFLPSIPVEVSTAHLVEHFADYVQATMGVVPSVKTTKTTKTVQVTQGQHDATTAARELRKSNSGTDYQRMKLLESRLSALQTKYDELLTLANNLAANQP